LQKDGAATPALQRKVAKQTAQQLAPLVQMGHKLVVVHGNGPQVGSIFLHEQALDASESPALPLDVCVAMSQGEIGYWLQQALQHELTLLGTQGHVATIVTQTLVDASDDAFQNPSKPIGQFYPNRMAAETAAQRLGFAVREDAGRGWRCVVPSPKPLDILEKDFIQDALDAGSVVIAAGGGGIPVVKQKDEFVGVAAVIDKDFAAEKLAELIGADMLLILTTVDAVSINFRQPDETPLGVVTPQELQRYINANQFAPGSMLPKVQAAILFVQAKRGNSVIITSPANTLTAITGQAGTVVMAV